MFREEMINNQNKMEELKSRLERLNNDYQQFLEEVGLTTEQIHSYIQNPDHFSPAVWQELEKEKKAIEEKFALELSAISDPLKTKKTFSECSTIRRHWLFVR